MDAPGNMTIVQGDKEAKAFLRSADGRVNDWLYELTDELTFLSERRLKANAPGNIGRLVGNVPAHETAPGMFEGIAGVEPDFDLSDFGVGLGSDPADYPVFVEVGTGIFGPVGQPISTIPGHLMGPIFNPKTGRNHYVQTIKGQEGQHYARRSHEEVVAITPEVVRTRLPDLGNRE